ncbi:NAD-dependent epimerase/dehydratase family protein [Limosilactobacillus coleohominis]|uniref:NAD-dependent epimerase/dehydratase family protein n=1 Tax=Limosilactobacillus coleohominis TaxID=181675 RepID=UPI002A9156C7|nr:NAD-dependent epimerase/dehydratase family protein [Limosilactobacillus coleohominis]MDY5629302.1 NAD-dependent epimerase/dehydratase family protein [Limosilactobacillus coleohominis]
MKKILVTGGTGFLAGWVIRQLLQQGYSVRTTVRSAKKFPKIVKMLDAENVDSSNLSYVVADLTSSNGWAEAMSGITDVLHLASPLGGNDQDNPKLITVAKEGVTHVINAAIGAHVNKIVMTSSEAANYPQKNDHNQQLNESLWTDLNNKDLTNYMRSKTVAENTAWKLIRKQSHTKLVTLLPGAIMGPSMAGKRSSTDQIFEMILKGMPSPNVIYPVVDVRDLADLHIKAMNNQIADNKRLIAESEEMTMPEMARFMKQHFPGFKVRTITIPNWLVASLSHFSSQMKTLNTMIGLKYHRDHSQARKLLNWNPRPAKDTVLDSVNYLIQNKLI